MKGSSEGSREKGGEGEYSEGGEVKGRGVVRGSSEGE